MAPPPPSGLLPQDLGSEAEEDEEEEEASSSSDENGATTSSGSDSGEEEEMSARKSPRTRRGNAVVAPVPVAAPPKVEREAEPASVPKVEEVEVKPRRRVDEPRPHAICKNCQVVLVLECSSVLVRLNSA